MKLDNINKRLNSITAKSVVNYLYLLSWKKKDNVSNKNLMIFEKDFYSIALPANEHLIDFYPKLNTLIETLSFIEDITEDKIIDDMKNLDSDLLEIRIISDFANNGSIPLNYASSFISGLKDLIISTACTEENPRPYYKKPTQLSTKYGEFFRFGQTKVGSFIISVESNPFKDCQMVLDDNSQIVQNQPFQRKIMKRLQKALYQVQAFGQSSNIDDFVKTAYQDGISANMCDAILLFNSSDDLKIESTFKWSKCIKDDSDMPETISISDKSFNIVKAISKAYKNKQDKEQVVITGIVMDLSLDRHIQIKSDELSGYISIRFFYENDEKFHKVKVYLEGNAYQLACDAHKRKQDISIEGILDKSGYQWFLDYPENIKIIDFKPQAQPYKNEG